MIFGALNPEKIWHRQLVHLPTLPVYCSHFTLRNPKKVIFQQYYSYIPQLFTYSQKKQTATVVLQLICLLTVVYCFVIVCVALFYGKFFYPFGQSFSEPPTPTHNRLFTESPTFGGMQHYLQSDVKVLHFTR